MVSILQYILNLTIEVVAIVLLIGAVIEVFIGLPISAIALTFISLVLVMSMYRPISLEDVF
jgi:isoprenylcysteine carboxyl methyltransferase (ICMT) family protein YpbQ